MLWPGGQSARPSDYHLARVSRGGATAKDRDTSNVRTHLRIHHPDDFEDLVKRDRRVVLDGGGMTSYFKATPIRGAPTQIEVDTLDSLLRLVTESLDPWERISSSFFHVQHQDPALHA